MNPELGHFALTLSLAVALALCFIGLRGGHTGQANYLAFIRPAATTLWALTVVACACLLVAFYQNDFSVDYVARQSNSQMPTMYRLSASWGGHEGSLLLWMLMLTSWMLAVAIFSKQLPPAMVARVVGILAFVAIGFLLFTLITSNPFNRLLEPALDGRGLNPMLQDPGLIFHPPLLYMGYVGFSVPFAFAIAALLSGRMDAGWARWSRPWTVAAWIFLTLGIALGSYWAYYELGWGGWWFWDPVENASFMPWLVGTALIHSLAVTEKRGLFKNWTIILAISSFSLSLLGTFLVRSGVLTSVHAFAADPSRGIFILAFLAVVVGTSLTLYALRSGAVANGGELALVSRETLLLANNVLLTTAMASVLLGTLYPLIVDALQLGKLSVGPPYFNAVFVPLMVPLLVLMGFGPIAKWKSDEVNHWLHTTLIPMGLALVGGLCLPFAFGEWKWSSALGLTVALWVLITSAKHIMERVRGTPKGSAIPLSFWAMHCAHIGIAVTVVGITLVQTYETEKDVRMAIGETVRVADFELTFKGVSTKQGPNYQATVGLFEATQNGKALPSFHPEKRTYNTSTMPMTEAAINSGITRDLYVSLGEPLDTTATPAWSVRIYHKPFVNWIWWGALLMSLGGLLATLDKRYRKRQTAKQKVPPGSNAMTGVTAGATAMAGSSSV
jgi:cytochrome c-type biogenesis protein CcmF